MRIGFLTCAFNLDESIKDNQPVRYLRHALLEKGHEVLLLDTDEARQEGDIITYPQLSANEKIDFFIGFYPGDTKQIPYFDQLKNLDDRFASPVPHKAQTTARDKTKLIDVFSSAHLPIPTSYNGNDALARSIVLTDIKQNGSTIVLKPDFGGSGHGIVRVNNAIDAQVAFDNFDERCEPFMMQSYIECNGVDYRAYVVGDQVLAGIKRTAQEGEWRTNLALGSSIEGHVFTEEQERDAVAAMKATGLAFGAVDILIDHKTGKHFICEVNDACSGTESIETGNPHINVARSVASMLERKFSPV